MKKLTVNSVLMQGKVHIPRSPSLPPPQIPPPKPPIRLTGVKSPVAAHSFITQWALGTLKTLTFKHLSTPVGGAHGDAEIEEERSEQDTVLLEVL